MPVPSQLLKDSIKGQASAQKELGFYLDSLMPLLGQGGRDLRKTVGLIGPGGPITSIVAGNGLTGGGAAGAVTLNVGAGNGIAVDVDSIRVLLAANSGLGLTGGSLAVGAGTGILVSGGSVAVDQAFTPTWTGAHLFQNTITSHSITPEATDTYDLGTSLKLWRKGWLSELDAILFAKNTITLLGGWFLVTKNEGALPSDSGLGTTIDFGQAMTNGDFVLFRGALMVEYMQVGAVVAGTTYNVTRNLDGTGANNWVAGSVYAVLGSTGNGRIELNAYDTPRISIITQGATYNAQTEVARLGDLNGNYGAVSELYGLGLGDYASGNYLRYAPDATGFVFKAGSGKVILNSTGLSVATSTTLTDDRSYRFSTASAMDRFGVYGREGASDEVLFLSCNINAAVGKNSTLALESITSSTQADMDLSTQAGVYLTQFHLLATFAGATYGTLNSALSVNKTGAPAEALDVSGNIVATGDVRSPTYTSQQLSFSTYLGCTNISASQDCFHASIYAAGTLISWAQTYYQSGAFVGGNYWTINLKRLDNNAVIATFNTLAGAAWQRVVTGLSATAMPTSWLGLYVDAIKVGAPGNLYLGGPAVFVQ